MTANWTFDVFSEGTGILAVLPFGELKVDIRRNPKPICKIIELAARKAYETTYFNIMGAEYNQIPRFIH